MSPGHRVAFGCYLGCALGIAGFGLVYLFRPEFMPYHAVAVGRSWEEIEPPLRLLYLALMKAAAAGWLATALALIAMLMGPFRRAERWAFLAIPAVIITISSILLFVTVFVTLNTPASPPWILPALSIPAALTGLFLSLKSD
jgi:formate hydrogenlyase subunit 3/multisubunit Na+/H+ antiporter MnhD subunit